MAKIKPLLSILSTAPLLLISLPSISAEDDMAKSKFSFNFTTLRYEKYESSAARIGFGYKPSDDSGLVMDFGLEHIVNFNYVSGGVDFKHDFTNLRLAPGYQFDLTDNFSITPSIGLAINVEEMNDINLQYGATQGYTGLKLSYDVTDVLSFVAESNYNFGSTLIGDAGSIGIGFKYTPQYKVTSLSLAKPESQDTVEPSNTALAVVPIVPVQTPVQAPVDATLTSSVTGVVDDTLLAAPIEEEVVEPVVVEETNYADLPYTIQIGAYQSMVSVNRYLQQNSINSEDVYTREINGLQKIYYKGFESVTSAKQSLASLKAKGVNGFVVNTPKQAATKPAVLGSVYAIQLGSFSTLRSADPIINKLQELDRQTFIKPSGDLIKLYTGKFDTQSKADSELARLKDLNITGFVAKVN
jgi:cell division septation protein DedD